MKIEHFRHIGDTPGSIRVSAYVEAAEFALARPKELLQQFVLEIVKTAAAGYFEQHRDELLASIDIAAIAEQVQSEIATMLVTRIVPELSAGHRSMEPAEHGAPQVKTSALPLYIITVHDNLQKFCSTCMMTRPVYIERDGAAFKLCCTGCSTIYKTIEGETSGTKPTA